MNWTAGTWRDVAIRDTVLGGDGYPWHVTEGLIEYFGVDGDAERIEVTMERDGAGSRTGRLFVSKPVKYEPAAGVRIVISCYACQRAGVSCDRHNRRESSDQSIGHSTTTADKADRVSDDCAGRQVHDSLPCSNAPTGTTPESSTSTSDAVQHVIDQQEVSRTSASFCPQCNADTHACRGCGAPLQHGTEVCDACNRPGAPTPQVGAGVGALPEPSSQSLEPPPSLAGESISSSRSTAPSHEQTIKSDVRTVVAPVAPADATDESASAPDAPVPGAPYVEYDDAERAAARALRGAGLTTQVVERVMSLDGLTSHLDNTHGVELPERGPLIGVEYRAVLADLHFELHAAGQEPGEKWTARGRTPHTHPVMDRPMENPQPRSWAKPLS